MKNYIILPLISLTILFAHFTHPSTANAAEGHMYWVNPAYKHLFKDQPKTLARYLQKSDTTTCHSYDEIKDALKENFEDRVTQFSIYMVYDFTTSEADIIVNQAFDEVREADHYLKFNILRCASSFEVYGSNVKVNYKMEYLTAAEQEEYVSEQVKEILSEIITDEQSDYENVRAIHDWILLNVEYDTTYEEYSAWSALYLGKTVCQGYSLLAYKMLKEIDMDALIIAEYELLNHAWNMVRIGNNWYHMDLAWDDPVPDVSGRVLYDNFLKSDTDMTANGHLWNAEEYPEAPKSYENDTQLPIPGDIDDSGIVNLQDAVLALQICTDTAFSTEIYVDADVNGDDKLGLIEVVYILEKISGIR